MEQLLEGVLIILLAATLFHALRLERALGVLKRDRAALEELVASFNSSTRLAEQGIDRLRSTADGAGRQISQQVDAASGIKDDLLFLTERGDRLANRLEDIIRQSRTHTPDPFWSQSVLPVSLPAEPARLERREPVISTDTFPNEEREPRLRSQAERDLLKALRMAR